MVVENIFKSTVLKYNADEACAANLWREAEQHYSKSKRHYHNLTHLENLHLELRDIVEITDHDTMIFALVYHDIIYKSTAKDNEQKSADLAEERLLSIDFPESRISFCKEMILTTQSHHRSESNDINLFTDADLSVLGKPWAVYEEYYKNVRREYAVYPDLLYNPGRKKVLKHFLEMPFIFKTPHFTALYEKQARENLAREFGLLK
jgi:predicted metal-dependent HD superfamily phosphohydrolase